MKTKEAEAKKLLHELRESISKRPSPFAGMTEEEIIEQLRKTRKELWDKKLALHSCSKAKINWRHQMIQTKKPDTEKARKHFEKLCRIMSQHKSPFEGMTEDDVLEKLRKTRKELWDEKLAARS